MSLTSDRNDYHLTASGWVLGTQKIDSVTHAVPVPTDCVLTVQQQIYRQGYQFDEEINLEESWRSDNKAEVDRLIGLYGELPKIEKPFVVPRRKK